MAETDGGSKKCLKVEAQRSSGLQHIIRSLDKSVKSFLSRLHSLEGIWGRQMFWIGYRGSLSASLPQKLLLLQHPHYWTKMKMRNHWLGFKTVLHESVEWLMWKVWRRSVFRCFRRAFVFLFGRTGRATLIPAPVSKCPSSRTWLDKFPLRWPCGPHGPTWTHTLQPWGRGQGENCKSGISDTVLIAKSLF